MKKLLLIATVAVFAAGLGLGTAWATDPPAGPIKVTNYGKKDVVTFDHAKHLKANEGLKCTQCHHKAESGDYKCGGCHKAKKDGEKPALKKAAHNKERTCWSCHHKKGKTPKKVFKCKNCHKG